jgi:Spy/CpxP family protein refolding chaperone
MMMPMMMRMPSDQQIDESINSLQQTLNLTPSQVTSIRQLAQNRRDQMKTIREQARPKFHHLMALLNQPNPDPAAVGRATIELKTIHDQAKAKQADIEQQLSKVLNPTQQQSVNHLRSEAETFMALRRLGLIAPEFAHGGAVSGVKPPTSGTGNRER